MIRTGALLVLGALAALPGNASAQNSVIVLKPRPDPREAWLWRMPVRCLKMPSVSMLPSFPENYTFYGRRVAPETIKHGDAIVFRTENEIWITRVVGLPGDMIQMRNGVVLLNGQAVAQRAGQELLRAWRQSR